MMSLAAVLVFGLPGQLLAQKESPPAFEGSVAALADVLVNNVWIVNGSGQALEAQLHVVVMGPEEGWIDDVSKPFRLEGRDEAGERALLSAEWHGDETRVPYDGKYGTPIAGSLSARGLLEMLQKAGFGPELPIEIGPITTLALPCCKPLDEKSLLDALDEAGLVGDKEIVGRDGAVRDGHAMLFFLASPAGVDEASAPGFGDRRKDVLQGTLVWIGGSILSSLAPTTAGMAVSD
jgi:hypothetical protein